MRSSLALIALLAFTTTSLRADDFWLAATPPSGPSRTVMVTGNVGQRFPVAGTDLPPDRVETWRIVGPMGDVPAGSGFEQSGQSFATTVLLPSAGTYIGVMTIKAREIEMTGKEFSEYLQEEGLDGILAARARDGEGDIPTRERYRRYAKIVLGDGGTGAHATRPLGLKAEFVPLRDPSSVHVGDMVAVQLLVDGRPIGGAPVTGLSTSQRIYARTDDKGIAMLPVSTAGAWLIRTVHMGRPASAGTSAVDWESYWVTLSFTVAGAPR